MSAALRTPPPDAIIRTFRAADVRGALAAVKAALGPEAVILDTRAAVGGLFGRDGVEVTAGVGIEVSDGPPPRRERPEPVSPLPLRASPTVARAEESALIERGIEPALARELVKRALAAGACDGRDLASKVRELAAGRLIAAPAPWIPGDARIVAVIGPPGVGKTTTIAKMAARAILDTKARVALITIDTWRIAASDQLLRYGEIMRVPAFVARDRESLLSVLKQCSGFDLVFIDTAGRSSTEALETQARLLRSVPGITLQLALAANSGARDIAQIAERYRSVTPSRAIITKTDEAAAPGALLSAFVRLKLPVSCVTSGQRVPEDIAAANGPGLAALLLGAPPAGKGN